MLRIKITLAFVMLVAAMTAIAIVVVRMDVGEKMSTTVENQIKQGANAVDGELRLRQASLLARAEFAGASDRLHRAMKGESDAPAEGETEQKKEELSFVEKQHLEVHEKLTAEKYKLDDVRKSGQLAGARAGRPENVEVFMALDNKGVGVAALGKDLFSWFGTNVSKSHPGVNVVLDTGLPRVEYWMWAFGDGEPTLHQVAIAPIRASGVGKPVGVVVLGESIDDGLAKTLRNLAAGLSADAASTDEGLEHAPHVLVSQGESFVASTFDSNQMGELTGQFKPSEGGNTFTLGESTFATLSRDIGADGESPVRFVIAGDESRALRVVNTLSVNIGLVGILILLLGIGILLAIIISYVRPLEQLETGMQEVIAGNKDYVWQGDGHSMQSSFAQSLNLMSATLQGKRMPDEDDEGGGWTATMDTLEAGNNAPAGSPKVQGVDLGMFQAPPPKSDD